MLALTSARKRNVRISGVSARMGLGSEHGEARKVAEELMGAAGAIASRDGRLGFRVSAEIMGPISRTLSWLVP